MRHVMVVVLGFLLGCGPSYSPRGDVAFLLPTGRTARQLSLHVGSAICAELPARAELQVRNSGDEPARVEAVEHVSGSATSVGPLDSANAIFHVEFESIDLEPGETGTFTVLFRGSDEQDSNSHESQLRLSTSSGWLGLTLSGTQNVANCEAPQSIDFGQVPVGTEKVLTFSARNPSAAPSRVIFGPATSSANDHLAFTFPGALQPGEHALEPETSLEIQVRFSPTEARPYAATMTFSPGPCCHGSVQLVGEGI